MILATFINMQIAPKRQRASRYGAQSYAGSRIEGLGGHHFYITYFTHAEGVVISDRLRAQHPEEITIVLQNQFEDLQTEQDAFQVTLSFNDTPERLTVPLLPSVNFMTPALLSA